MALGVLLSLLAAASFSTSAIFAKLAYAAGLNVGQILQLRFTLAVPLMILFLLIKDRTLPNFSRSLVLKGILLGGMLYGIQSSCYYNALLYIPASTASLILYFYPVAVAIMAKLFFKQAIGRVGALALAIVAAGCGLVFFDAFQRSLEPLGLILAFGASATYSCYLIALQVAVRNERPLILTFHVILFAALTFNLLGDSSYLLHIDRPGLIFGGGLALFSTIMGLGFLYLAVDRLGSAHAAVIFTFEPILVVALSRIVLNERIVVWQIAGMILIIAGIIIKNLSIGENGGRTPTGPHR